MQNGRKTNMNRRQPRPAAPLAGRSKQWSSNAARPEQNGSHNGRRTMNGIWRSLKLKRRAATQSRQKTTTSTPNIISDRCPRIEERHRRLCYNDRCYKKRIVSIGTDTPVPVLPLTRCANCVT